MGAATTLATLLAAAAGGVAVYRYLDKRARALKKIVDDASMRAGRARKESVIDFERDPETGVFHPSKD